MKPRIDPPNIEPEDEEALLSERREMLLTEHDLNAIAKLVGRHPCRFANVDPQKMQNAIEFYDNCTSVAKKSSWLILATLIVGVVGGFLTLMYLGVAEKIREIGDIK